MHDRRIHRRAVGVVVLGLLLAGCSGGSTGPCPPELGVPCRADAAQDGPPIIDGPGLDGESLCNVLSPPGMQGCNPGQKCTWITLLETPVQLGKIGCVPDGTVAINGACTQGAPGETTGFDDCVAGNVCIAGTCQDICGFDGSANAACAAGYNCTRYSNLFGNNEDDPIAGACSPGCNPITQLRSDGIPCGTGQGCYLLTSSTTTVAVCAGDGDIGHNVDIVGPAFANSCVPGAQPRRKDPMTNTVQCGGLCNPVDVTSTTNMASEGGAEIAGNPTAKDNCQTSWGANPPQDGTGGESCRYWWAREPFEGLSPYSNTVGWCFKHAVFQYDSNGDMTNDAPFPRCTALTTGDVVPPIGNPMHNDAQYFWCVALPATLTGSSQPGRRTGEVHLDRLDGWRDPR